MEDKKIKLQDTIPTSTPQTSSRSESVAGSIVGGFVIAGIIAFLGSYPLTLLLFSISGASDPGLGGFAVVIFIAIILFIVLAPTLSYYFLRKNGLADAASKFIKVILGIFGIVLGIVIFFLVLYAGGSFVFDKLGI